MRTHRILVVTVLVAVATMGAGLRAQKRDDSAPLKPPTVLFMCPHGAATSVLASAYFERLAKERGLNVRVESAGTDPDPTVSPAVAAHLKRQGYPAPGSNPRKVTSRDLESADVVISIGCFPSANRAHVPRENRSMSFVAGSNISHNAVGRFSPERMARIARVAAPCSNRRARKGQRR